MGDPDGYGTFAELDDDGHTVGCHECGRRSRNLGLHVRVHGGMTAAGYRQAHGLSTGQALIPADLARELAEHSRNSPTSLAALAANRDPDRARAANTTEGRSRPQRRAVRQRTAATARLGRPLTVAQTTQLTRAITLDEWAQIARRFVGTGASHRSIAAATGVPASTVSQRLTRLAPR